MSVDYAMTVRTGASFDEANAQIRDALKVQGFGVLTEIDVQSTLRQKLGEEMEQYVILGPATRRLRTGRCRPTGP
jgi:uncharacterized protein (DUF302 family)